MKKSELKTGHIVEIRDGSRYFFMKDCVYDSDHCGIGSDGRNWRSSWLNEDLTSYITDDSTVMRVYECPPYKLFKPAREDDMTLIWERKEVEEMTIEEICKALGKEIKVIEG